jgi:lysophospholipase L1-like esterase
MRINLKVSYLRFMLLGFIFCFIIPNSSGISLPARAQNSFITSFSSSSFPNLLVALKRKQTPRILFFGDSTFAGSGLSPMDFITSYFKQEIEARESLGKIVKVINIAEGGNTTREMTGRAQHDILDASPRAHLVIWAPGVNDIVRRNQGAKVPTLPSGPITPQQYRDELIAVGSTIIAKGIDLILVDPPQNPDAVILSGQNINQPFESTYSKQIRKATKEAAVFLGCGFFSRAKVIEEAVTTWAYSWSELFQSDGLHPSALQNEILIRVLLV